MKRKTIVVDIKDVKGAFPGEWSCLDYCISLVALGEKKTSRLECWNYERENPEADWIVPNIGKYVAQERILKKLKKSLSSI